MIKTEQKLYFKTLGFRGHGPMAPARANLWPLNGDWTVKEHVAICASGWHVTNLSNLHRFYTSNAKYIYIVETRGKQRGSLLVDEKKAFAQARLVRKLSLTKDKFFEMFEKTRKFSRQPKFIGVFLGIPYTGFVNRLVFIYDMIKWYKGHKWGPGNKNKYKEVAKYFLRQLERHWKINLGIGSKLPKSYNKVYL